MTTTPVRVEGDLDNPSRWMWLVKWLLAIPHYIILFFLWLAFLVLTIVAFVAILITARYPGWIYRFNLGVLRWTWRVDFYGYNVLGTDRYPPFTLGPAPDYPARLDIAEPGQLSRGLVLVKWWLLALPHYLVIMIFYSGLAVAVGNGYDEKTMAAGAPGGEWMVVTASGVGLVTVLLVFVAIALLFTGRYPRGLFDFLMGIARWWYRVLPYAFLMTDTYPPFRIDLGAREPVGVEAEQAPPPEAPPEAPPEGPTGTA
ncbi:DUF4389 domain-containing protein [Nocardiopsis halophila]|uniref:DUF4389 domain-containing protein n=1 Tax=Nocardiopsis halophila TaxID=141692 RepID=UPI000349552E|nr:DUF4389 domain-containing protein [Nocardiopsis halophila]